MNITELNTKPYKSKYIIYIYINYTTFININFFFIYKWGTIAFLEWNLHYLECNNNFFIT